MDKNELDKLEALAKAATPGPWTGQAVVGYRGNLFEVRQGVSVGVAGSVHDPANASYIAAFNPAAILELIALARAGSAAPAAAVEPSQAEGAPLLQAVQALQRAKADLDVVQARAAGSHKHVDAANQYQGAIAKLISAAMSAAQAQPKDTTKGQA